MLTDTILQDFHDKGFLRLPGAVSANTVKEMRDRLWALLEEKGAMRNEPTTWDISKSSGLHDMRKGDQPPSQTPIIQEALEATFDGQAFKDKDHWGQVLLTFSGGEPWRVPSRTWHSDHHYTKSGKISGLNMFLYMDRVEPGGGGTTAIQASHTLVMQFLEGLENAEGLKHGQLNGHFMQSHPWLKALINKKDYTPDRSERFMGADFDIDGVATRVIELTGEPGDVILCHPLLIHAPAPNASDRPRMMRVQRYYRQEVSKIG